MVPFVDRHRHGATDEVAYDKTCQICWYAVFGERIFSDSTLALELLVAY